MTFGESDECPEDGAIAGTTTDVPGQRLLDLILGRLRVLLEQVGSGNGEAGCAEAALDAASFQESFLDRVENVRLNKSFNRRDSGTLAIADHDQAGANQVSV